MSYFLILIKIIIWLIVSGAISIGWWNLWMYEGWYGTPKILHKLFFNDGESSYDFTLIEMFVMTSIAILVVYYLGLDIFAKYLSD